MQRFKALDADFHARGEQLNAATTENDELRKEIKKLIDDLKVEKTKTGDLTNRLADAQAAHAADLKERDEKLAKSKNHDIEDHKAMTELAARIEYERASKAEVQKNLDQTTTDLRAAEARLKTEAIKIVALTARIATLEAELEIEKREGERLRGEKGDEIKRLNSVIETKEKAFLKLQEEMNEKAKELRTHMHEGHVTPAPAPTVVPEPKLRFKCNIRSESSRGNSNVFFDLNGAGGQNPPVHAM